MPYKVKEVADLAGINVRALHHSLRERPPLCPQSSLTTLTLEATALFTSEF